jgi:hypothetical protein
VPDRNEHERHKAATLMSGLSTMSIRPSSSAMATGHEDFSGPSLSRQFASDVRSNAYAASQCVTR